MCANAGCVGVQHT